MDYESFGNPFDNYGNFIYNKCMFIDWQVSALELREDWE